MSKAKDMLLSGLVLVVGRGRRSPRTDAARVVPKFDANPGAETAAILLLFLGALCCVGFLVVYGVESIPHKTQYLGLSLGLALVCMAASMTIVARKLIVTEELVEEYPPQEHVGEVELIAQVAEESGDRFTRKRLFKLGLLAAGGGLATAALAPALSFGPLLRVKYYFGTPWTRGRRLVDEDGKPWKASDIEEKDFYTAFPEGANEEELGSPVVLVRLPTSTLNLPPELKGYDAGGVVAYSKICTHAGCAIAMYRVPTFAPPEPRPPLLCPC